MAENHATLSGLLWQNNYFVSKFTSRPIPVAAWSIDVGLRPLAHWDCGFEFRLGHDCLSFVNIMFRQARTSLCDGPIPRSEEQYRACVCVCVCHWGWSGTTMQQYPPSPIKNRETEVRIKETESLLRVWYESARKVSHEDNIDWNSAKWGSIRSQLLGVQSLNIHSTNVFLSERVISRRDCAFASWKNPCYEHEKASSKTTRQSSTPNHFKILQGSFHIPAVGFVSGHALTHTHTHQNTHTHTHTILLVCVVSTVQVL